MSSINSALENGKMATINIEILVAQIQGNPTVEGDVRGLDAVSKYYLDMIKQIEESEKIIRKNIIELEEMIKEEK